MSNTIGVGFIGAGSVTQAIHLPTLATMADRFRVERVMDVNPAVAQSVASRCDAAASVSADEVLEDRAVEIVAICSPNAFHAEQVVAACRAGKRAVLCEKPLAVSTEEVSRIVDAAAATATPVLIGTTHAYDPAYREAHAAWSRTGDIARLVQSSIYLPSNSAFIDQATDQVQAAPAPAPRRLSDAMDPAFQSSMLRAAMLGLAIHNIPLVRHYYPSVGDVLSARFHPPFGYSVVMSNTSSVAQMCALMPGRWPPQWSFRVLGAVHELRVSFPPSYVLAGSARAEFVGRDQTQIFERHRNGYEEQWRHLYDVVEGGRKLAVPLQEAAADLQFAFDIADRAKTIIMAGR